MATLSELLAIKQYNDQQRQMMQSRAQMRGLIGTPASPFRADTFPGEEPIQGLYNKGTGLLAEQAPNSLATYYGKAMTIPGYEEFASKNLGNLMDPLRQAQAVNLLTDAQGGSEIDYKDVRLDDNGQPWGRVGNKYIPLQTPNGMPVKYKTAQSIGPNGEIVTNLIEPSKVTQNSQQGVTTIGEKPLKPLPEPARSSFDQAFEGLRAVDLLRRGVSESGRFEGQLSKFQTWLGFNDKAMDFETGRNNMKLAAQSLIKGIPSNFDVQTVINTLPALGLPEAINRKRLAWTEEAFRTLVSRTVAYYKGTGYKIPEEIYDAAALYNIDVGSIKGKAGPIDMSDINKKAKDIEKETSQYRSKQSTGRGRNKSRQSGARFQYDPSTDTFQ